MCLSPNGLDLFEIINSYDDSGSSFRFENILLEKYFNKHKIRNYKINMEALKLVLD